MTLAEMVSRFPTLFYQQSWHVGHDFMALRAAELPPLVTSTRRRACHHAADLALSYLTDPEAEVWREFIWTSDFDNHGNRVYVGGCGKYGIARWQIHRHLADPGCVWVRAA